MKEPRMEPGPCSITPGVNLTRLAGRSDSSYETSTSGFGIVFLFLAEVWNLPHSGLFYSTKSTNYEEQRWLQLWRVLGESLC